MHRLFSLRLTLPLLIGAFVLLAISVSFYVSRHLVIEETTEHEKAITVERLNFLRGVISHFIKFNEADSIRSLVVNLSSESDLVRLGVVSKEGDILASNKLSDQEKSWKTIVPPLHKQVVERIVWQESCEILHDEKAGLLTGYISLCEDQPENKQIPQGCGFVFYQLDLKYHYKKAESSILRGFISSGLISSVGILLLLFVIGRLITRRVRILVEKLTLYSNGDHKVRPDLSGHDELSWLSQSINSLLNRIDETQDTIVEREQRLETLFQTVLDAIVIIDDKGIIQRVNKATEKLFAYSEDELVGNNISILMPKPYMLEHDEYLKNYKDTGIKRVIGITRELKGVKRDNSLFPIEISVTEMMVGNQKMFSGIIRDITERKEFERIMKNINDELLRSNKKLNEYATKDSLTNIYNRRAFDMRIDEELNRATRDKLPLSLLMCDIDYFKLYNDTYGHQQGDTCLYKVATVIKTFFQRGGEMVARYGGEEFAVILPNTDTERARWLSELLLKAIHELNVVHGTSRVSEHVTISIGVGTYNPSGNIPTSPHHLIRAADEGLYKAKSNGRDRVEIGATID